MSSVALGILNAPHLKFLHTSNGEAHNTYPWRGAVGDEHVRLLSDADRVLESTAKPRQALESPQVLASLL